MTKRDFFILLIKLFALFSLVGSLFSTLPHLISYALMDMDLVSMLFLVLGVSVLIGLFLLLIFRADKVVRVLKLDKGFDDERIDIGNLKSLDVIRVGLFIIGGFLLIDNIPLFLNHTYFELKRELSGMDYHMQDRFYWAISSINLIMGYLLLTNYGLIAGWFRAKEKED